jgi:hypothetical protein
MWTEPTETSLPPVESIPVAADLTNVFLDLETVYPTPYASCFSAMEEEEELCRLIDGPF